jgi:hypothetical protein
MRRTRTARRGVRDGVASGLGIAIAIVFCLVMAGAIGLLWLAGGAAVGLAVGTAFTAVGAVARQLDVEDALQAIAYTLFGVAMALLGGAIMASAAGALQQTRWRRAPLSPAMRIGSGAVGVGLLWIGVLAVGDGLGFQPPEASVAAGFRLLLAAFGVACLGVGLDRARGHLAARRYPYVIGWTGAMLIGGWLVAAAVFPDTLLRR